MNRSGVSLVEVLVAVVLLSIGLAALVGTDALITRTLGRGRRATGAATLAHGRLERLRATACTVQAAGAEEIGSGGPAPVRLSWVFRDGGGGAWSLLVISRVVTAAGQWRTDSLETLGTCAY
jgi:prepilin-type N-terminal cleavage/methylation domain-containing protein